MFSFNYVDIENDILVIDDLLGVVNVGQGLMDGGFNVPGWLWGPVNSLCRYNDDNFHLERVRHVAIADTDTLRLWIQLLGTDGYCVQAMQRPFDKSENRKNPWHSRQSYVSKISRP